MYNAQDAAALRQFINTASGKLFLEELKERRPRIVDPEAPLTIEARALNAERAQGWEDCMEMIFELSLHKETVSNNRGMMEL